MFQFGALHIDFFLWKMRFFLSLSCIHPEPTTHSHSVSLSFKYQPLACVNIESFYYYVCVNTTQVPTMKYTFLFLYNKIVFFVTKLLIYLQLTEPQTFPELYNLLSKQQIYYIFYQFLFF